MHDQREQEERVHEEDSVAHTMLQTPHYTPIRNNPHTLGRGSPALGRYSLLRPAQTAAVRKR